VASPSDFTAGSLTRSLAYAFDLIACAAIAGVAGALLGLDNPSTDPLSLLAAVVVVYQTWLLWRKGGVTLGKYLRNIGVISTNGQPLVLGQAVARSLLVALPYALLSAGRLDWDVRAHGVVALVSTMGVAYLFADLLMLEYSAQRRTITDRLTGTLVVMLPPLQPHRAPAGPMFSANDAEFGNPPRMPPQNDGGQ
jgi:uncharacterized RDD family membrane protein YckC